MELGDGGGNGGSENQPDFEELETMVEMSDDVERRQVEEEEGGDEEGEARDGDAVEEVTAPQQLSLEERLKKWSRSRPVRAIAPVWGAGDGFTVYTKHRLPLMVVCETCVADGSLRKAEINYGKDKSTTALKSHLSVYHKELYAAC